MSKEILPEKFEISTSPDVGEFIRARRKTLKVTQKDLADLTGLSIDGISRIEKGERSASISTLVTISKILGFRLHLTPEESN